MPGGDTSRRSRRLAGFWTNLRQGLTTLSGGIAGSFGSDSRNGLGVPEGLGWGATVLVWDANTEAHGYAVHDALSSEGPTEITRGQISGTACDEG